MIPPNQVPQQTAAAILVPESPLALSAAAAAGLVVRWLRLPGLNCQRSLRGIASLQRTMIER
jgi:hypothetical protein